MEKGYKCKCGMEHKFPPYVYAHWHEALTHTCDCGRKNIILRGAVKIGNKPKGVKHNDGKPAPV